MKKHNNQQGAGLLEVMIGLFVLAIGLLGFAGLQSASLAFSQKAYANSQAAFMAQDILERVRANRGAAANYKLDFDDSPTSATDCSTSACTADQMATWDLSDWSNSVSSSLTEGAGEIVYTNNAGIGSVAITVRYLLRETKGEDQDDASADSEGKQYSYIMSAQI